MRGVGWGVCPSSLGLIPEVPGASPLRWHCGRPKILRQEPQEGQAEPQLSQALCSRREEGCPTHVQYLKVRTHPAAIERDSGILNRTCQNDAATALIGHPGRLRLRC